MLQAVLKESQMPNVTKKNTISVFSTTSLGDIMKDFSEMSVTRVAIGYVAMVSCTEISYVHHRIFIYYLY